MLELPFWTQIASQSYEYLRKSIFSPVHSPCCGRQPTMDCVLGRHRGNWTLPLACWATAEPTMATTAVAQHGYSVLPFLGREREEAVSDWWSYKKLRIHQLHRTKGNTKPRAGSSKSCLHATPQVLWSSSILKLQIYSPQEVVSLCRCKE